MLNECANAESPLFILQSFSLHSCNRVMLNTAPRVIRKEELLDESVCQFINTILKWMYCILQINCSCVSCCVRWHALIANVETQGHGLCVLVSTLQSFVRGYVLASNIHSGGLIYTGGLYLTPLIMNHRWWQIHLAWDFQWSGET